MTEDSLFISDLHLAPERPAVIDLFCRFAGEVAGHADTLFILGDFLEYWLGDDDRAEGLQPVFEALLRLHDAGTRVKLMHGNRDFLIGDALASRCGFERVHEPLIEPFGEENVLLLHGDVLCTDDVDYQKFRAMVRDPAWIAGVLSKSLEEREQLARSLRETSRDAVAQKAEDIMDVNPGAVAFTMRKHGVRTLIHGHTHRPGIHRFELDGREAVRIVLGDWYTSGSCLRIHNGEFELVQVN